MQTGLAVFAAFNLVCDVQRVGDDVIPPPSTREITFRIDPVLGRWCSGSCPAALPIAALSGSEIVLIHQQYTGHLPGWAIRIGAVTGDYRETSFGVEESAARPELVGRCERAPFSGFPPESLDFAIPLRVAVPASVGQITPGATPR
jgi:hypothetical protein